MTTLLRTSPCGLKAGVKPFTADAPCLVARSDQPSKLRLKCMLNMVERVSEHSAARANACVQAAELAIQQRAHGSEQREFPCGK